MGNSIHWEVLRLAAEYEILTGKSVLNKPFVQINMACGVYDRIIPWLEKLIKEVRDGSERK